MIATNDARGATAVASLPRALHLRKLRDVPAKIVRQRQRHRGQPRNTNCAKFIIPVYGRIYIYLHDVCEYSEHTSHMIHNTETSPRALSPRSGALINLLPFSAQPYAQVASSNTVLCRCCGPRNHPCVVVDGVRC